MINALTVTHESSLLWVNRICTSFSRNMSLLHGQGKSVNTNVNINSCRPDSYQDVMNVCCVWRWIRSTVQDRLSGDQFKSAEEAFITGWPGQKL